MKEKTLSEKLRGVFDEYPAIREDVKQFIKEILEFVMTKRYLCNHRKVVESEELIEFIKQKGDLK